MDSLLKHGLFDEIVYYGDTARVPYGIKDSNTIIRYGLEAVEFFNNFDIDMLITACNTVSAHALSQMRDKSGYDVHGVIAPGIRALTRKVPDKDSRILILGTRATIASGGYQQELRDEGYDNIDAIQTGMFVPIVEEGIFEGDVLDAMMEHYFSEIEMVPDAVILGCTHFPLISEGIRSYFGSKPLMIHSGESIVEYLEDSGVESSGRDTKLRIFASDNVEGLRTIADRWLDRKV